MGQRRNDMDGIKMMKLTVKEIAHLAGWAGLYVEGHEDMSEAELNIEMTIKECPREGIINHKGEHESYKNVCFFTDYHDQDYYPLGDEIKNQSGE